MVSLVPVFVLAACFAVEPDKGHTTAAWKEAWWGGSEKADYRLDIDFKNTWSGSEGSYNLIFKVKRSGDRIGATFTWQETKQGTWVLFAFPIRVAGEPGPLILVRAQTSWGIDTSIYAVGEDGCDRQFSYSFRDQAAIHWQVKDGALTGFTVYDRWSPDGVKKESNARPGIRWEKVIRYTRDPKKDVWQEGPTKWQSWDVNNDKGLGKDPFAGERDCPFAFGR